MNLVTGESILYRPRCQICSSNILEFNALCRFLAQYTLLLFCRPWTQNKVNSRACLLFLAATICILFNFCSHFFLLYFISYFVHLLFFHQHPFFLIHTFKLHSHICLRKKKNIIWSELFELPFHRHIFAYNLHVHPSTPSIIIMNWLFV